MLPKCLAVKVHPTPTRSKALGAAGSSPALGFSTSLGTGMDYGPVGGPCPAGHALPCG